MSSNMLFIALIILVVVAVAVGIYFSSKEPPLPDIATVLDKDHTQGYTMHTMVPVTVGKTTIMQPQTVWIPPSWKLLLQYDGDAVWHSVSEETYNRYEVGDTFVKEVTP